MILWKVIDFTEKRYGNKNNVSNTNAKAILIALTFTLFSIDRQLEKSKIVSQLQK